MLNMRPIVALRNQDFCYWLQGYFELAPQPVLTSKQIQLMLRYLDMISEPHGPFTGWLKKVCLYCQAQEYRQETLAHFLPLIQHSLNKVFHHVIDNSYDTDKSSDELQNIHDGIKHD